VNKQICYLGIAGFLIFASVGSAQYTMDLTGVGDGVSADGVYVSPYNGTITPDGSANPSYSGYMICDDFNTESFLGTPWTATSTNAGNLNGTEKFTTSSNTYNGVTTTVQQNYDAVAWLANGLLASSNVTNATAQINYSFAIWDIFNNSTPSDPVGGASSLITQAFAAVAGGYVGSDVTVYTASDLPNHAASQEFLVMTPEPGSPAILGFDLLSVLAILFFLRRYRARA